MRMVGASVQRTGRSRAASGLTLVELLVVVAVIMVVAGLLFPALAATRTKARSASCQSLLRQIATALRLYADDYSGGLPTAELWDRAMIQTLHVRPPLVCPDVHDWFYNPRSRRRPGDMMAGYAYNGYLAGEAGAQRQVGGVPLNLSQVPFPATTVAFCEAKAQQVTLILPDMLAYHGPGAPVEVGARRHQGGSNYAFLDGHVKWYRPEQVDSVLSSRKPDGSRPDFRPF